MTERRVGPCALGALLLVLGGGGAGKSAGSDRTGGGGKAWGYVLGGVGIVGLGVAVGTGIKLVGVKGEIAGCKPGCSSSQLSDGDAAKGLVPVYYAGWVVAAVGLGLGGYLLYRSSDAGLSGTSIDLRAGPGSIQLGGRF